MSSLRSSEVFFSDMSGWSRGAISYIYRPPAPSVASNESDVFTTKCSFTGRSVSRIAFVVGLLEKFADGEIDQFWSDLKCAVPRSRHHEKLPARQTSKYLRGLFDRREVMIARHDQHRRMDFLQVTRIDHN